MTSMPPSAPDREYNAHQLLRMDEAEARKTLTVEQYERWKGVQELHEDADDRRDEWEAQGEVVTDVTVSADMEDLGVRVDVFGNSLLVHADPESPDFRQATNTLEDEFSDIADEDIADDRLDPERASAYAEQLVQLLDAVLVKWDDAEWAELDVAQQEAILGEVRDKWGLSGLQKAWGEIVAAIREDHEEVVSRLEKFRDEERRGDR